MADDASDVTLRANQSIEEKLCIEEYKLLRGEIELRATEQRSMERRHHNLCRDLWIFIGTKKSSAC